MRTRVVAAVVLFAGVAAMGLSGCGGKRAREMSYRFDYDKQGRLTRRADGAGRYLQYSYDREGRLASVKTREGTVRAAYDAAGNLTSLSQRAGKNEFTYDPFGRLTTAIYRFSPERRVEYRYDPWGQVAGLSLIAGGRTLYRVSYEYDLMGNLLAVDDGQGRIEYAYDPAQGRIVRRLPNGVITTFSFSATSELVSIRHEHATGGLLAEYRYAYNATGHVTTVRELTPQGEKVLRYEWDGRGYLTALHPDGGAPQSYAYDAMGNRVTRRDGNSTLSYTYDEWGRLTRCGQDWERYDKSGYPTTVREEGRETKLSWAADGRLLQARLGRQELDYQYDGLGNLVSRRVGEEVTDYLPNPLASGVSLAELDRSGQLKSVYLYGDGLLGRRDADGQMRYFLEDGFSSIRQVVDRAGRVVGGCDYSPFAEITHAWGEQTGGFRSAGEWQDPLTRYWMIYGRIYDAAQGRNLAPDLMKGDLLQPDSFNSYAHSCRTAAYASPRCNQTHTTGASSYDPSLWREFFRGLPQSIAQDAAATVDFWRPSNLAAGFRYGWEDRPTPGTFADQAERAGGPVARKAVQFVLSQALLTEVELASGGLLPKFGLRGPLVHLAAGERAAGGAVHLGVATEAGGKALLHFYPSRLFVSLGKGFSLPYGLLSFLPDWQEDDKRKYRPGNGGGPGGDDGGGGPGGGGPGGNPFGPGGRFCSPLSGGGPGGIDLNVVAHLAGGLGQIVGAVYDPKTRRVVLVGDDRVSLPPLSLGDLAVALKCGQSGEQPMFSLDPADPHNPKGPRLKCVYYGPIEDTSFGEAMFQADWLLKAYSFGVDGEGKEFHSRVPGFQSIFDLSFAHPHSQGETWMRFWITCDEATLGRSGNSLRFDRVRMKVNTEQMWQAKHGDLVSSGGKQDPVAARYAEFFTQHYDAFGEEQPAFARVKQLACAMALANWLNDLNVPLDLSWVEEHANPQFNTPEEVGALSGSRSKEKTTATYYSKQTVWLFGGVDLGVKPTFVANDAGAGALGEAVGGALGEAPHSPTLTVSYQGRNLRGLVLPITAEGAALWKSGEMRGPDGTVYRYDASLRVTSLRRPDGTEAKLAYDSGGNLTGAEVASPDGRLMGKLTPAGSEMNVSSPAGDKFDYRWDGAGWLEEVRINNRPFVRCRHDRAANRSTLDYGAYREELTFDPRGRLIFRDVAPVTRAGGTRGAARVAYDADGQLASLEIPGQGQLRITRTGGDVTSLVGPWSQVRYGYDASHRLTGVAFGDASARFVYQGEEMTSAEWSKGGEVLRARFSGGRIVEAQGLAGSAVSYEYDPQGRLARASESGGGSAQYTYDDHHRIRGLTLPGGGSLEYRYTSPRARRGGEAADPGELQMIIRHPENARRRGELPAEQVPSALVRLARQPWFAPEEFACLPRSWFQVEAEAEA